MDSENSNTKNTKFKKKRAKRLTFYSWKPELHVTEPKNKVGPVGVKKTKWVCLNMISHSYAQLGN